MSARPNQAMSARLNQVAGQAAHEIQQFLLQLTAEYTAWTRRSFDHHGAFTVVKQTGTNTVYFKLPPRPMGRIDEDDDLSYYHERKDLSTIYPDTISTNDGTGKRVVWRRGDHNKPTVNSIHRFLRDGKEVYEYWEHHTTIHQSTLHVDSTKFDRNYFTVDGIIYVKEQYIAHPDNNYNAVAQFTLDLMDYIVKNMKYYELNLHRVYNQRLRIVDQYYPAVLSTLILEYVE
jgi:hypothetical protein